MAGSQAFDPARVLPKSPSNLTQNVSGHIAKGFECVVVLSHPAL